MWWRQPNGSLNRLERWFIAVVAVLALAFTGLVVHRSAFQAIRMTDAEVYFRAAWAVRTGLDPYSVRDSHGWSYTYPPGLAVLLVPLADAPPGEARRGLVPYAVSVALWLAVLWAGIIAGAHWTAGAVDRACSNAWPVLKRRWWYDRLHPALICLGAVGDTLSRGQVNAPLHALIAAWLLAMTSGRRALAGLCLGFAAGLKVVPALLLILPAWRRDWRGLAGSAAGIAMALWLLPAAAMGPLRAWEALHRFADTMVMPQVGAGGDRSKESELAYAVDNQSLMAVSHNIRKMASGRPVGRIRPDRADRLIHWGLTAALASGSLWTGVAAGRRGVPRARVDLLVAGMLLAVMIAASPVSHLHYALFALPLVAVLLSAARDRGGPTAWGWVGIGTYAAWKLLPHIPELGLLKLLGLPQAANLGLWGAGLAHLLRGADPRRVIYLPGGPSSRGGDC